MKRKKYIRYCNPEYRITKNEFLDPSLSFIYELSKKDYDWDVMEFSDNIHNLNLQLELKGYKLAYKEKEFDKVVWYYEKDFSENKPDYTLLIYKPSNKNYKCRYVLWKNEGENTHEIISSNSKYRIKHEITLRGLKLYSYKDGMRKQDKVTRLYYKDENN